MSSIDIFYQGENIRGVEHIAIAKDETFGALKRALAEKHGLPADILIFVEDGDEPVDSEALPHRHAGRAGVKVHLHRCRHVAVGVTFNGETVRHPFTPAATVARVKTWAAEKKFGMTPAEAAEHVLQIAGTTERPDPGTHLGALTAHPRCSVDFHLVPNERVNGFERRKGASV